jgi:hypothetical protein
MSEHNLGSHHTQQFINSLVLEIEKIPQEYWTNLLQIIRLYGESLAKKSAPADAWAKAIDEIKKTEPVLKVARQQALSELLRKGQEEGDEQEQTETAEVLRKALEENSVSI